MNNIDLSDWFILNEPGEKMYAIHLTNVKYIDWCTRSTLKTEIYFMDNQYISFDVQSKTAAKLASIFGIDDLISYIEKSLGCSLAEQQAENNKIGF
jgi:hypothetical protein